MAKSQKSTGAAEDENAENTDLPSQKAATGADSADLQSYLLHQSLGILICRKEATEEERNAKLRAGLAALEGIGPRDELEGMLAAQMFATHNTAMECLHRAMLPEQTPEGSDYNLKHAGKFLSIYTRQMEALDKHRGKGRQKITVEHVNVEAGGQAIVGNVETTSKETTKITRPAELEQSADPVMPSLAEQSARKKSTARRKEPKRGE